MLEKALVLKKLRLLPKKGNGDRATGIAMDRGSMGGRNIDGLFVANSGKVSDKLLETPAMMFALSLESIAFFGFEQSMNTALGSMIISFGSCLLRIVELVCSGPDERLVFFQSVSLNRANAISHVARWTQEPAALPCSTHARVCGPREAIFRPDHTPSLVNRQGRRRLAAHRTSRRADERMPKHDGVMGSNLA